MTDAIGWLGTVLIVAAYGLNVTGRLKATDRAYLLCNLAGAVCVGLNVYSQGAWPALALQVVWGLIAIGSLIRR